MKTKNNIFKIFLIVLAAVTFYSCDVALGSMLDIEGPVVEITSPAPRKSVPVQFDLEGTVTDYSGVGRMIIKASTNNTDFQRQWRYQNGVWEISDDFGASWRSFAGAQLIGTEKSGKWIISVDMDIDGNKADGEYTFSVQAWDKGEISDDNSFKTIVLILDLDPPKVDISRPYLYRGITAYEEEPLKELHDMLDDDPTWQNPGLLGKFVTQEFSLNWQIEDSHNVWSIDLRFYPYDTGIDNDPDTILPDNYIYRYHQNLPPPPDVINPLDYVKPNGSVKVPDLDSPAGFYDGGGEIKNRITEKTTVKVIAVCFDAAGNANQEKTLGYFIYWPKANSPWIAFTEGLMPPDSFYGQAVASIEQTIVMVYPGRSIKATAFQSHGVKEVHYSLYKCDTTGGTLNNIITSERENTILQNKPYSEDMYSNIFPWEFQVPPRTGYYLVKAQAFSTQDIGSEEYTILFRVQDITFPDFPTPPNPIASDPLFKSINANKITITGIVSDATEVVSLCLVWINPESRDYAAMNQLSYFRDKDYQGWTKALTLSSGGTMTEDEYDSGHPNRLWRLSLSDGGVDIETNRKLFNYSLVIDLDDLNIGIGKQPLKSQIFLFRAQNPDGKCTIITYAPQGDTLSPVISITNVVINRSGTDDPPCEPGEFVVIQPFIPGDTITINGTWREDSLEFLDMGTYFTPNFNITVNNQLISDHTPPFLTSTNSANTNGTWTITAAVGTDLSVDKLKDTLVVSADVKDIGGNFAESGCSWLIQSDNLRLMRISSEEEDKTYKAGDTIEIFLEFSKPVRPLNTGSPVLLLNSTGTGAVARAIYKGGQTNQNSRQYFVYTVATNQDTMTLSEGFLNVTGLENAGAITAATYPFAWFKGEGVDREEVRLTMTAGNNGNTKDPAGYYIRTLPTTNISSNPDYQFTLVGGKHIAIDTLAPAVTSITSNTTAGYYNAGDIYMTVNFNKPVTYTGTPRLSLQITNGTTTVFQTSDQASDIRVSGNSITFKYSIKPNDTTNGAAVLITGHSGTITGLAGNTLAANGISGFSGNKTLTGVYIETLKPAAPTVRVLSANNVANVVQQNVSGTTNQGLSTYANRNLSNLYNDALWLAIQQSGAAYKCKELEYSINGDSINGATWVKAGNIVNTPFPISQTGVYALIARQIDQAGNVSDPSNPINFTWDRGTLITRISSTTPNGTYTNVAGRNQIDITVYFRKPLSISGAAQITINAQRNPGPNNINVTAYSASADRYSMTFTYTVADGDSIPGNGFLDVTGISGVTAWDGTGTGNGVNVSTMIVTANLPPASPRRLDTNKEFMVETGNLTVNTPVFIANATAGTGYDIEANANFHGIRSDDGSYWTSLDIPFNRAINKGSGNITITQNAANYRLPSVLTEAQYNRFKGNASISADIDTYYTKGTNGYINGTGSDTSTKYVLQYNYNPNSGAAAAGFTGDIISSANTDLAAFMTAFRNAEAMNISVNAQAVTIVNNNTTLRIRLSGSSAPQVPGAAYTVTYPAGLVTDNLGNSSAVGNHNNVALRGVAKPFVRIRKTQDTIATGANNATTPRLIATQPIRANARLDCRTPASDITYTATDSSTNVTNNNWGSGYRGNNYNTAGNGDFNGGKDGPDDTAAIAATRPANATTTPYTNSSQIPLGDNAAIADVQGYQWWVRSRATTTAATDNTSTETEEVAYRTVITYQLRNLNGAITAANGESILANGDQVWIRGGDAIGSSSIPGFPLTWEDNWDSLSGKRAGIRLMTKTNNTDPLNNSVWKFVTWEINTTAYVDFIRGSGTASSVNIAWQYGPDLLAYQRAGWSSFKDKYPIYPGKHRWCDTGYDHAGKYAMNFSGTLMGRPAFANNSPSPFPNVNTQ
jgi:hypothetical protein